MKVLVIGLGSMGKRRIRLIKTLGNIDIIGVDNKEERRSDVKKQFDVECYDSIEKAISLHKIDGAIISTSPLAHASLTSFCLERGIHVFTELNLVSAGYKENIQLAKDKNLVLFMSSTKLYRKEIQTIIEKVKDANCPLNYIYHVGQYLPDWHPWENYKDYFIGNPATNGVREILAIELPWIVTAFGEVESFSLMKSKNTSLNIDYDDNYLILLKHVGGNKGVLAADVVSRKAIRNLDVFGELLHLNWNPSTDTLLQYDFDSKKDVLIAQEDTTAHQKGYASFVNEKPYLNELKAFFDYIDDRSKTPLWDYEKDLGVLDLIDEMSK